MGTDTAKVTATTDIVLQPMETRTVTGFLRKSKNFEAAVTEPIKINNLTSTIICPRVVSSTSPEKSARIPVRICNISAKPVKIKSKSSICLLQEVKVLRQTDITIPLQSVFSASIQPERKQRHEYKKSETEV